MIVTLYYPEYRLNYKVDIGKDEYLEYLWEKEIGKPFDVMTYFLEPLGKDIYNKLEEKWFKDELPLFDIRQESNFYTFLVHRFKDKAELSFWKDEEERQREEDFLKLDLPSYLYSLTTDKDNDYMELNQEELEEIFLDNFMGEV